VNVEIATSLLEAQDALVLAVERHDRLYRSFLRQPPGLLLTIEADPLRAVVLVRLIDVDAAGRVVNVHGEARLSGAECEVVAGRIVDSGDEWAMDMWSRVLEVTAQRWEMAS